ncbi:MAG: CalY family protein [Chloroflexota bacterium]|nr:CalY family protein [Chloroflexota bacterium]
MDQTLPKSPRPRLLGMAAAGLAVVAIGAGMMSLAAFTDSADVDGNSFTTGTVDISTSPTTALFTVPTMMPGDASYGELTVSNSGTASLRYTMSTAATNADSKNLRDQLRLEVRQKATGTCSADFTGTPVVNEVALQGAAISSARTVAVSGSETLCFKVSLPFSTGNDYQGATTTATFTFSAEQTANQP